MKQFCDSITSDDFIKLGQVAKEKYDVAVEQVHFGCLTHSFSPRDQKIWLDERKFWYRIARAFGAAIRAHVCSTCPVD